jgi:citrate synthase
MAELQHKLTCFNSKRGTILYRTGQRIETSREAQLDLWDHTLDLMQAEKTFLAQLKEKYSQVVAERTLCIESILKTIAKIKEILQPSQVLCREIDALADKAEVYCHTLMDTAAPVPAELSVNESVQFELDETETEITRQSLKRHHRKAFMTT